MLGAARHARAGGPTSHLAQASYALGELQDPVLKAHLVLHLNSYLNGANFPDTFNVTSIPAPYLPAKSFYSSDEAHSPRFLNTYAAYVVANPQDGELLAHFMGTLAHVVGDQRFDRYFMTRVTRQCFPDQYAGTEPTYAQVYTDWDLDWVLSPLRYPPAYPGSGILTPSVGYVPWAVGHWSPLFVPPSILEQAFPSKTPIGWPVLGGAIQIALTYIHFEPYFIANSLAGYGPASTFCDHAEATWSDGLGGAHDGGRAIADYINRVHEIIKAGGLPVFEGYGKWPNNEMTVRDGWAADPVAADYGSWIAGPQGVARIELEGDRVVALQDAPAGQTLLQLDGFLEDTWEVLLSTSVDIAELRLEGDATGVLLEDHRLLVNTGEDAVWHEVLSGVSAFQLEGRRVAALVQGVLWLQEEGPLGAWAPVVLPPTGRPGVELVDAFQIERDPRLLGGSQPESGAPSEADGLRIAVLTRQRGGDPDRIVSRLLVGEGTGGAFAWQGVWQQAHAPGAGSQVAFQLDGRRTAYSVDGTLRAWEGPLLSATTVQQTDVAQFQMKGGCLAALTTGGELRLQRGELSEPWQVLCHDVAAFELEGYNPSWPKADPWIAYTLQDQTLLTNRTAQPWPNEVLPHSHEHSLPGTGAPAAFRLETTAPLDSAHGPLKLEDRLAVLLGDQVFVQELARFPFTPTTPQSPIWLSLFEEALFHRVQMNWHHTEAGPKDYVAIFDGDPQVAGPNGYLAGPPLAWQWATNGPSWTSLVPWAEGYHMAYVEEDAAGVRTITQTWGPTQVAHVKAMSIAGGGLGPLDTVRVNVDAEQIGGVDYVALYDRDPLIAGPDGYLTLQWKYAILGPLLTTTTPYKAGYYGAYISESATGVRTILDVVGPTTTTNENVWLTQKPFLFWKFVQLNWSVTSPGAKDYVALYDKNPNVAGPNGYLFGQWTWATNAPSWLLSKSWGPGYYMAYIQEDALGVRTIKDTWGPSQ